MHCTTKHTLLHKGSNCCIIVVVLDVHVDDVDCVTGAAACVIHDCINATKEITARDMRYEIYTVYRQASVLKYHRIKLAFMAELQPECTATAYSHSCTVYSHT